ncbi:DUF55-domain-containing protein [Lentithecium fluviatile CBS 122367]|uniref:Thymocyte nuclear protein 1 n=1 Tax=Lentithecium fluviatile CBS 122367 TaxID=1168545 RepID=A0A6G1II01_9PLEO|nr:DUF55-domain-containing protein [Lentithecium fluviatile CBS 122367]
MSSTRRSTRQSAAPAPKYADSSPSFSDSDAPKRNDKKAAARRKRVREPDADVEKEDGSPPPKKAATPAAKSKAKSKAKPKPAATTKPTAAPALTASPTNRDAAGNQDVYWLFKAEPTQRYENGQKAGEAFSIDDLQACTKPEPWTGVRNPQATSIMKEMRAGDLGFFYHSNAKPSGVVGILRVVQEAKVDETAFDKGDAYFDPKSTREKPRWWCVGVEFVKRFEGVVDLGKIKGFAGKGGPLEGMQLVRNSRLSVSRVTRGEWEFILGLAEGKEGVEGDGEDTKGEDGDDNAEQDDDGAK